MGEDRTGRPGAPNQRVTVPEAAELLGITAEAVRMRIKRGTLRSERQAGRVFVLLGQSQPTDQPSEPTTLISEMVEEMRDEVHYLRGQLHQELERRSAEAERYQQIVAALTAANASLSERLRELEPPQETPPEARESPETVEEAPDRAEAQEELGAERARREMAETTLHEGMAEERRRREAAERERDDLRGQLYARSRQQGAHEATEEQQGRGEPQPDAPGAQEGARRRPWWRRIFGS